jgi:hypothetical protein
MDSFHPWLRSKPEPVSLPVISLQPEPGPGELGRPDTAAGDEWQPKQAEEIDNRRRAQR